MDERKSEAVRAVRWGRPSVLWIMVKQVISSSGQVRPFEVLRKKVMQSDVCFIDIFLATVRKWMVGLLKGQEWKCHSICLN